MQPPDEDDAAKAQPLLVDRDPEVFKFVLAYLRTGHVELRPPVTATVRGKLREPTSEPG